MGVNNGLFIFKKKLERHFHSSVWTAAGSWKHYKISRIKKIDSQKKKKRGKYNYSAIILLMNMKMITEIVNFHRIHMWITCNSTWSSNVNFT